MFENDLVKYLFEHALQQAKERDDIWWQIRSLQELGRTDEIDELVLQNKELIEHNGRPHELEYLQLAKGRAQRNPKSMKTPN
jgi:hypothetical protein